MSEMFFFCFEYSWIGYASTITAAKTHESAGIKIIVYRMKSTWLGVNSYGFCS